MGITNDSTGLVQDGIYLGDVHVSSTITNFGTISGNDGNVAVQLDSPSGLVVDEAHSEFIGQVIGGGGTLELVGRPAVLNGLGTNFLDFGIVEVTAGSNWRLDGTNIVSSGTTASVIDSGTLILAGTSTISGSISGAGTLVLDGSDALSTGAVLTVYDIALTGGETALNGDITYGASFAETAGTILLGGNTLSLTGAVAFDGGSVASVGVLSTSKRVELSNLKLTGGAIWRDFGGVFQTGGLMLGNAGGGSGRLSVARRGIFDVADNAGITVAAGGTGTILNAGLFEKTGGTGVSTIAPAVANTGTILVAAGTLDLHGALSGVGRDEIGITGTLKFDGAVGVNQAVSFVGTKGGDLVLNDPLGKSLRFAGSIIGFRGSDLLDLETIAFSGKPKLAWVQSGDRGTLTITSGTDIAKITLFGQYVLAGFHTAADGHDGTSITYTAPTQQAALTNPHR